MNLHKTIYRQRLEYLLSNRLILVVKLHLDMQDQFPQIYFLEFQYRKQLDRFVENLLGTLVKALVRLAG